MQTPVSNPVINRPYGNPDFHWELDSHFRATDTKASGRRPSGSYLSVPVADRAIAPGPSAVETAPHPQINRIREEIVDWRAGGYDGAHRATRELLSYWSSDSPEPRPFFAQVEALETLIWLTEAGARLKTPAWRDIREALDGINRTWNETIPRLAVKMATGTGKTRVMAMIILWQALVRRTRLDVLVITPNITVLDRLRELDPRQDMSLYCSLAPPNRPLPTGRVHVTILNFQAFQQRDRLAVDGPTDQASGAVKRLLRPHGTNDRRTWQESQEDMLARLLTAHCGAGRLIVLNDEAHHCYRPASVQVRADRETTTYEEQAALWFNVLRTLHRQERLEVAVDLSATPMYLRTPPGLTHTLFPWAVSDYPLIDAVEAGLTKIPRVPVRDDTEAPVPLYRDTFNQLGSRDRRIDANRMPQAITDLLAHMHDDYNRLAAKYAEAGITPVMIVVANTARNANEFYRHIAGYYDDSTDTWHPGAYWAFSNTNDTGPVTNPPTLLVHSGIEDPGDPTQSVKGVAKLQRRFFSPGDDAGTSQQAAYIRKAFGTVGQKGQPGEHVRCIVSVSMLTEGWDVRTVTHIFGFRAFKSQLLCEQVAGRALRRTSFPVDATDDAALLPPEYARIFGVPFSFMRGDTEEPPLPPPQTWPVQTLPNRHPYRIRFPNVGAYRMEPPAIRCRLDPDRVKPFRASAPTMPTVTTARGAVGRAVTVAHDQTRDNQIVYRLAAQALDHFEMPKEVEGALLQKRILFASMVEAVRAWLRHPAVTYPDLKVLGRPPNDQTAPLAVAEACVPDATGPVIRPVFADELDPAQARVLDTSAVAFQTSLKHRYPLAPEACATHSELNAAACHSQGERDLAQALDTHPGILAWARSFRLGWHIPYLDPKTGVWRSYEPDFIARAQCNGLLRYLVIEFKGNPEEDAETKTRATEDWWLPAVNGSDDPVCDGDWRYVFVDGNAAIMPALERAVALQDTE